ncbi:hypothetical protein AB0C13_01290 [Streptomyces sp. NPDC049099]|uniref:hypothetical protein n=1 Tax=Streptomyces sp. NPDC049099 TaxID=3155768 RepID=UPI003419A3C9
MFTKSNSLRRPCFERNSPGISAAIAFAMAGVMCGIGAQAANAAPVAKEVQPRAVGANEIWTVIGIGSGAAGLSKALAKGA